MLGQHPDMYGLPELHLFAGDTLYDLYTLYKIAGARRQDGLMRVVAELYMKKQTKQTVFLAQQWMKKNAEMSTAEVFQKIMDTLAPRIAVEKSVTTVWRARHLERVKKSFPDARYLHLSRHPRAQSASMIEVLEREPYLKKDFLDHSIHPPVVDPQFFWLRIHSTILDYLEGIPADNQYHVRGEDVIVDPDAKLAEIAGWLGIRTDAAAIEAMKHPEASPYSRLGPPNAPFGSDPKFLQSPELRPGRASKQSLEGSLAWRDDIEGFSDEVRSVAMALGYE
jgi:hypothetical protein